MPEQVILALLVGGSVALLADLFIARRKRRRDQRSAYERWERYQADLIRQRRSGRRW